MGKPQLSDVKKLKVIHPKSRKAKQLSKKLTRDVKMKKKKAASNMRLQILGEKLFWFKNNCDSALECYSLEESEELIQRYIDRNMEELRQIKFKQNIGHRKSRQHASREDLIRICRQNEMSEFLTSGFETIDLTDKENLTSFKIWKGELKLISNLKLKKFIKSREDPQKNEASKNDSKMLVDEDSS